MQILSKSNMIYSHTKKNHYASLMTTFLLYIKKKEIIKEEKMIM